MRKIVFLCFACLWFIPSFGQTNKEIKFSTNKPAGFYLANVDISFLHNQEQEKIYFTTDGSEPNSKSKRYKEPIKIEETTVLRGALYIKGKKIKELSNTFFIGTQHDLPVVSISTNPENLWSADKGIYVEGCCADTTAPYRGANYWRKTEIKSNFEFFTEDKKQVLNQTVGVRIFGGFTRSLKQKSLSVIARKKYGSSRLEYSFFKTKPEIKKFKSVVLRNSGGDFNKSNFRDGLLTHLASEAGLTTQAFQPVVVYLNGKYWGIQNLREKISEHFIESNFDVDKDSVDIMRHRYDLQHGSSKEYRRFLKFVEKNSFKSNEKIRELAKLMDVDNYLLYHASQVYFDNQDMSGNTRYWREKGEGNRWSWLLFDTDLSFSISGSKGYKTNTLEQFTTKEDVKWPNPPWSTFLIRKLLENDSIKQLYIRTTLDLLNTTYSESNVLKKIDSIAGLIEKEIPRHSNRWNRNEKYWLRTLDVMREFAKERPSYLRQHLQDKFETSELCIITIRNNRNHGRVDINGVKDVESFSGTYLKGIEYSLKIIPNPDYLFVGWENEIIIKDSLKFTPNSDMVFKSIYKKKNPSKFSKLLKINEIKVKNKDWIELYNLGHKTISLNNWTIHTKKGVDTIRGKSINPQGMLVLNQDEDFYFNISSKSDSVKIYDEHNLPVVSFFVTSAKGEHYALKSPYHNPNKMESWLINYKEPSPGETNIFFQEMINSDNVFSKTLNAAAVFIFSFGALMFFLGLRKRPSETTLRGQNLKTEP